jgi:hypothetical protein
LTLEETLDHFLGEAPVSSGLFIDLSTLAVVAAMNDTNGGLYMALMGQYGKPEDGVAGTGPAGIADAVGAAGAAGAAGVVGEKA